MSDKQQMTTLEERFLPHTNGDSNNNEAQQCAQICEEVALQFADFISYDYDIWSTLPLKYCDRCNWQNGKRYTAKELFTLFINQKQ
jgi:hypothetical protein